VSGAGKARAGVIVVMALLTLVVVASLTPALARTAPKPGQSTEVGVEEGRFHLSDEFSPKVLPRERRAPISWSLEASFATLDGSHVPALTETQIELDRSIGLQTAGLPRCGEVGIQTDVPPMPERCKESLVGRGREQVEILFEEARKVPVESPVGVYFLGQKGPVAEFALYAYITLPVPTALIATMKVERIDEGHYGLRATTSFPKIAGGAGSITSLSFTLHRAYMHEGRRRNLLSARCGIHELRVRGSATFADGMTLGEDAPRACIPAPQRRLLG
jgi:hypothetical protein